MKLLRTDQGEAIEQLREALVRGRRRVVMQGSTGYGKTLVAASIIERALERGKRVLFTVPALSLVDQTVEVLHEQGIGDVGVIQGHHERTNWSKPVQVASVQTLIRRELPTCDLKLIDEVHIWFKLYEELTLGEDQRRIPTIGLSATPWTKGLGRWFEELIIVAETRDLIERGLLSPFRTFAPSHPDLEGVKIQAGDYHEGQLAERMSGSQLVGDIVTTWQEKAAGRPTVLFAVNRAHAKMLSERFQQAGVSSAYMDCQTPLDERKAIARRFAAGDVAIVCNVDVVGVGVDWPTISCVIYARPTRSEMRFVQNIGRSLRTAPGKTDTLILDHSDTTLRLGFVSDIGYDELHNGTKETKGKREMALPKECPSCGYLKPPRTPECPNCGFRVAAHAKVTSASGELEELVPQASRPRTPVLAGHRFMDRSQTLAMLRWYAKDRGYAAGWASHKFKELYGGWPSRAADVELARPSDDLLKWIRSTQIRYAKRMNKQTHLTDVALVKAATPPVVSGLCTEQDLADFR